MPGKCVKAKKAAAFGTPHLPTTGTEVAKDAASLESSYACCHGDGMMYTCACVLFKHLFSHEPVSNSNSKLKLKKPPSYIVKIEK